jgi:hypothetical protein
LRISGLFPSVSSQRHKLSNSQAAKQSENAARAMRAAQLALFATAGLTSRMKISPRLP